VEITAHVAVVCQVQDLPRGVSMTIMAVRAGVAAAAQLAITMASVRPRKLSPTARQIVAVVVAPVMAHLPLARRLPDVRGIRQACVRPAAQAPVPVETISAARPRIPAVVRRIAVRHLRKHAAMVFAGRVKHQSHVRLTVAAEPALVRHLIAQPNPRVLRLAGTGATFPTLAIHLNL